RHPVEALLVLVVGDAAADVVPRAAPGGEALVGEPRLVALEVLEVVEASPAHGLPGGGGAADDMARRGGERAGQIRAGGVEGRAVTEVRDRDARVLLLV